MGFGASVADVSLFSAGLPKGYGGGGFSVGALGLLKEKPPEAAAAGVASASLLAAPKRKVDGAEGAALSFFSSGFPKVNVGAVCSLSACSNEPKVEPPCGAVVTRLGSPSLPKTELPVVVVAVVVALVIADVMSSADAGLSLFP